MNKPSRELIRYIQSCLDSGMDKKSIKSKLFETGWLEQDIENSFNYLENQSLEPKTETNIPQAETKKPKTALIIVLILIIFIVLASVFYFVFLRDKEETVENDVDVVDEVDVEEEVDLEDLAYSIFHKAADALEKGDLEEVRKYHLYLEISNFNEGTREYWPIIAELYRGVEIVSVYDDNLIIGNVFIDDDAADIYLVRCDNQWLISSTWHRCSE